MTIGALSRQTGVKVPTIRYYEQIGLLSEPGRTAGNQRRYDPADLERLQFIRHARDLGFSLENIRALTDLSDHPTRPCADANRIAADQLTAVRDRIARLQKLEAELDRIANHCGATGTAQDCYVLHALSDHGLCDTDH